MAATTPPRRGPRLVLDLPSGTAVIDGEATELPRRELHVLVELAAHPRQVVPTSELIEKVWPDVPGMTPNDLYTHVHRLRRRIKDSRKERRLIRNRRGFGYLLDLPREEIRVVEGLDTPVDRDDQTTTAPLAAPPDDETAAATGEPAELEADAGEPVGDSPPHRPPLRPRLAPVAVVALIAAATIGGSWFAGYLLSQRGSQPVPNEASRLPETTPSAETSPEGRKQERERPQKARGRSGSGSGGEAKPADQVAGTLITSPPQGSSTGGNAGKSSGTTEKKPPPPPPQPDAQLFHLHHPESGDRYMTTSSATANQKQAGGYGVAAEGRVFTTQVKGTIAINLDDGVAYIYRSRDSAPQGVSVTELYRLTKSGDLFFTKSPSVANQAEAQGWSRSLAGFVQ